MKHRTLFSFGVVLGIAVAAAGADLNSDNTFGILSLSDNSSADLVISVPWVDCTDASQNTYVSNVVKTTNLTAGDYLIRKTSGGVYQSWELVTSGGSAYWVPTVVQNAGVTTTTEGADTARIARGDALWLHRQSPSTSTPIYLFGQFKAEGATTSVAANTTTLVANPGTSAMTAAQFAAKVPSLAKGDKMIIGNKTYTCAEVNSELKWTTKRSGETVTIGGQTYTPVVNVDASSDSIPAGTGFWFQPVGARTINW